MDRYYYVYLLASGRNGTLYTGVTNNLSKRVWSHKEAVGSKFTSQYGVKHLVYYERFEDVGHAITREKQLKRWRRAWKIALIERDNPQWLDRYETLNQ